MCGWTRTGLLLGAGRAPAGPLEGEQLEPVVFTQALWYAWRSVRPDTTVWGE